MKYLLSLVMVAFLFSGVALGNAGQKDQTKSAGENRAGDTSADHTKPSDQTPNAGIDTPETKAKKRANREQNKDVKDPEGTVSR